MNTNEPVSSPSPAVEELLARSRRYGSDPAVTNYGGGNTSVKESVVDPTTGASIEIMRVKGSGGDLATLGPEGLATMDLQRLTNLDSVYRGAEHEDEMVDLFAFCGFGPTGPPPSIDTPMHALVSHTHVDHLHPDSAIGLACAADGERLVAEVWQGRVAWVPWIRPGWELGKIVAELSRREELIGAILGGHGMTAWGRTSDEVERRSMAIIDDAATFIAHRTDSEPFGPVVQGHEPFEPEARREFATAIFPHLRSIASTNGLQVGHFSDDERVLDFLSRQKCPELVAMGTSCPDHLLRTKIRPLLLEVEAGTTVDEAVDQLAELHAEYRAEYYSYYKRHATGNSPAFRGADPTIVLIRGVGMFSFGADKQTARVAGEFYINAINVMRYAEGVSSYQPIDEAEKFSVEYWELEERKLRLRPTPKNLAGKVAIVTGSASGIGLATVRLLAEHGANVVVADIDGDRCRAIADELGGPDAAIGVAMDVTDPQAVRAAIDDSVLAFGGIDIVVNNAGILRPGSLADTKMEDWDLQYAILARGSFLTAQATERVFKAQGYGGDILNICSKNAVFAGTNNVAYSSAKAAQAHLVRLLAVEFGGIGVRVNGINPDGVVRGSRLFSEGWGASRATSYGVDEKDLGKFYAERTILRHEVFPEDVAMAVLALTNGTLPVTTGLIVPVDSGAPQAFVR